jgi:hypothetical protein
VGEVGEAKAAAPRELQSRRNPRPSRSNSSPASKSCVDNVVVAWGDHARPLASEPRKSRATGFWNIAVDHLATCCL